MDCQVASVSEGVGLVVFIGREPGPFVVVPGASDVGDEKDGFVVYDPRRPSDTREAVFVQVTGLRWGRNDSPGELNPTRSSSSA